MNESFIAWLWKSRLLGPEMLTDSGDTVSIIHPGDQNSDSGPDFFNARLRIGETLWAGNVEIHWLASDWYRHRHDSDPAYDQVVLHVVYDADRPVFRRSGERVPSVAVRSLIPARLEEQYTRWMSVRSWVPCYPQLHAGLAGPFSLWAPALATERLAERAETGRRRLAECGGDWREAFYRHLAAAFGFRVNALPFELLARSLPLILLQRYAAEPFRIESLLFGQSGLLSGEESDDYPASLRREYLHLRAKHGLNPLPPSLWKFLRMRPLNFPTLRIGQFSALISPEIHDLFRLVTAGTGTLRDVFHVTANEYWCTHSHFDRPAKRMSASLGPNSIDLLLINGILPFRFFFGLEKGDPALCRSALEELDGIRGERDHATGRWMEAGLPVGTALHTQALIRLRQAWCLEKRCLDCRIGDALLHGEVKSVVQP